MLPSSNKKKKGGHGVGSHDPRGAKRYAKMILPDGECVVGASY